LYKGPEWRRTGIGGKKKNGESDTKLGGLCWSIRSAELQKKGGSGRDHRKEEGCKMKKKTWDEGEVTGEWETGFSKVKFSLNGA